jgi:hypothetical protein
MIASDWRAVAKDTLCGFFTLLLPSGLTIRECALHKKDGARWVALPARAQIDPDGKHRTDPATGKRAYTPILAIPDRERRERFQRLALAAIDQMLGGAR